tara:strand:+ start:44 stop:1342 length:1299 start_codon:yes stop_codon:yes gene_type:complete
MKSFKNKSLYCKILILSVLIIIPVSILYLNLNLSDPIFNNKEHLENNKNKDYINICRNQHKANIYETRDLDVESKFIHHNMINTNFECKTKCNNTNNCNMYLYKNATTDSDISECLIYTDTPGDKSEFTVNCNNEILDSSSHIHRGYARVTRNFYNENKDRFVHDNYMMETANTIQGYFDTMYDQATTEDDKKEARKNAIENIDKIASHAGLTSDKNKNVLFSEFVQTDFSPASASASASGPFYEKNISVVSHSTNSKKLVVTIKDDSKADAAVNNLIMELRNKSLYKLTDFFGLVDGDKVTNKQISPDITCDSKCEIVLTMEFSTITPPIDNDFINSVLRRLNNPDQFSKFSEYKKFSETSKYLDAKMINDTLEYNRKYLVYTILSILMVISAIFVVVYKFVPNLISDYVVFSYFIGVLVLLFFIHNYFKV